MKIDKNFCFGKILQIVVSIEEIIIIIIELIIK